jgi:hypothetical protein
MDICIDGSTANAVTQVRKNLACRFAHHFSQEAAVAAARGGRGVAEQHLLYPLGYFGVYRLHSHGVSSKAKRPKDMLQWETTSQNPPPLHSTTPIAFPQDKLYRNVFSNSAVRLSDLLRAKDAQH